MTTKTAMMIFNSISHIFYSNLINGDWKTNKPYEIVVSDGTMITFNGKSYDLIYVKKKKLCD